MPACLASGAPMIFSFVAIRVDLPEFPITLQPSLMPINDRSLARGRRRLQATAVFAADPFPPRLMPSIEAIFFSFLGNRAACRSSPLEKRLGHSRATGDRRIRRALRFCV